MAKPSVRYTSQEAGFSLVEVLLASAIFGLLTMAVIGAIIYGRSASGYSGDRIRGVELADEGVQALRNLRNANYTNLTDGTYGLVQSNGTWSLSGSSDTTGVYTRQVVISTPDSTHKAATVNVSWPQGASTAQTSVATQFTNWAASLIRSWVHAVMAGSTTPSIPKSAVEVATQGDYAYVILGGSSPGLEILNVSNPASPVVVKNLSLPGVPTDIDLSGNYAYISSSSSSAEVIIVDISTPASAHQVSTYNASGSAPGLAIQVIGSYVYLTRGANGGNAEFSILNISTPSFPFLTGSYSDNVTMDSVYVSGSYAYIGTSAGQLLVINLALPFLPLLATSYSLITDGSVNALDGFGNTLLVGQSTTMSIINISNPTAATRTATLTTAGAAGVYDITHDSTNTYAFLGTSYTSGEFQVVDISNLSSPNVVRTVDVPGTPASLFGVAYNNTYNEVIGASASDSQGIPLFIPN